MKPGEVQRALKVSHLTCLCYSPRNLDSPKALPARADSMHTSTLTSLAILRVTIDHGGDYLSYLQPLLLQVLVDERPELITTEVVRNHILNKFGLVLPAATVQLVLKRITRRHPIKREHGVYQIRGPLPDPRLISRQQEAELQIKSVVSCLYEYSQATATPLSDLDDAEEAVCAFLSQFDVTCLRAYLQRTAIPPLQGDHGRDIVLVSSYVKQINETDTKQFDNFQVLMQGHMLANALLCPNLAEAPRTYQSVTFYLDTPLVLDLLGLDAESKQKATHELIELLQELGGNVAIFSHTRSEVTRVLRAAADQLEKPEHSSDRGVVAAARRRRVTRSDMLLFVELLDEKLSEAGLAVMSNPLYREEHQIDEASFEEILSAAIRYVNPRARQDDINSVRSIYAIRGNHAPTLLERSRAVLVTSNADFASAAWDYGQRHESSRAVSSVITNFSLANTSWLKSPMKALSIPRTQMLAFAFAAMEPTEEWLSKFMTEIDRLQAMGAISERDHQLLRSSPLVHDELMYLTLGEDTSLNSETITDTLSRVSDEIRGEESEKLSRETRAHSETREALSLERSAREVMIGRVVKRCERTAGIIATSCSAMGFVLVLLVLTGGLIQRAESPTIAWTFVSVSLMATIFEILSLTFGSSIRGLHALVNQFARQWLLRRQGAALDIDLTTMVQIEAIVEETNEKSS